MSIFVFETRSAGREDKVAEDVEAHQISDIVCDFEFAIRACAFCMHDTFGDTLAVEVSKKVDQVEVLQ